MNIKRKKDMAKSFHRSTTIAPIHRSSNATSFKHFARRNIDNSLSRKEFRVVRWNCWFRTIFATIAYYLLQRSRRYDVANSRYRYSKFPHCNASWRLHTPIYKSCTCQLNKEPEPHLYIAYAYAGGGGGARRGGDPAPRANLGSDFKRP